MFFRPALFTRLTAGALALCALSARAPSANAQTLEMRDGSSVQTFGLRRDGETVIATIQAVGGQKGEVGYPLASITRIDFPEPALLKTPPDAVAKGLSEEALRQIAQAVSYYQPFIDMPGNWWKPLMRLQIDALIAQHRDRDLDAIAAALGHYAGTNPSAARFLKFRQAAMSLRQNNPQKVLDLLGPVMLDNTATADDLAEGWLDLGGAHLALQEYDAALLAYLHVPVYTPERKGLMSAVLLGSIRAYIGIDDKLRAKEALNDLATEYPTTSEAAEARERLTKTADGSGKPGGG